MTTNRLKETGVTKRKLSLSTEDDVGEENQHSSQSVRRVSSTGNLDERGLTGRPDGEYRGKEDGEVQLVQSPYNKEASQQVVTASKKVFAANAYDAVDQKEPDVENAQPAIRCCCCSFNSTFCGCCRQRCPRPPSWLIKSLLWIHRNLTKYFTYPIIFALFYTAILGLNYDLVRLPKCRRRTMLNFLTKHNDSEGTRNGTAEIQTLIECRGGEVFSVLLYYCCGSAVGALFELVHIPGLVGMLGTGLFLRNIGGLLVSETVYREGDAPAGFNPSNQFNSCATEPVFDLGESLVRLAGLSVVEHRLSGSLRQIALMTILIRAGLGLDPRALKRLLGGVLRLTVIPCVTEALTLMLVTHFMIGWPLAWGAVQGFICAAVSPAILVPSVIRLQAGGWGVAKGIPTLLIASSSLDDVVAITSFSVSLSFAVATRKSVALMVFSAPTEAIGGVVAGVTSGCLLFLVPTADMTHGFLLRSLLFVCVTVTLLIGSVAIQASGAGALACIAAAFTLARGLKAGLPWTLKAAHDNGEGHSGRKEEMPALDSDHANRNEIPLPGHNVLARRITAHIIHMELTSGEATVNGVHDLEETSRACLHSPLEGRISNPELHSPTQEERRMPEQTTNDDDLVNSPSERQQPTAKESGLQCLSKFRSGWAIAWVFIQPFLFTLIGAELDLKAIDKTVIMFGVISILAGLTARLLATVLAVLPNDFNMRERLFIAISWMPKATVQAALGAVALDTVRQTNAPAQVISWGGTVLTIAVLSIIMTAPLGAVLIHMTAPCLLSRELPKENSEGNNRADSPSLQADQIGHPAPSKSPAVCDMNPSRELVDVTAGMAFQTRNPELVTCANL